MGKHGPCCHCGVTSTPLWRNGPPEKPVLCNACGSRWRTKGSLVNYTPLHARAEPDDFEDYNRVYKVKTVPPVKIKNKDAKVIKRKYVNNNNNNNNDVIVREFGRGVIIPEYSRKVFDEDISNRSSSGSAISNTESCAQYGSADASDLTGPSQPVIWDSIVPSRKRTCFTRPKPSPVEKLTKDLYTIWHEQQSSCLSACSEEDLLLESDYKPMASVEFGHGSVLIRHPREEESEASSLSFDSHKPFPGLNNPGETPVNFSSRGFDKMKKPANHVNEHERIRRDMDQLEKLQILAHHNSPLSYIDLQDVLNFDKFASYFTSDEQQQLLKLLPCIDTLESPDSNLRNMFNSPQFKENLLSFQKLLADGVFDNSTSGLKTEDCKILKKFVLCNSSKSKWVEQYKILKDSKGKKSINELEVAGESNAVAASDYSVCLKKTRDGPDNKFSGPKAIMKIPRRVKQTSSYDDDNKDTSFLSPKSLLSNNGSLVLDEDESDLLVDVPSNGSFPQAELIYFPTTTSASSSLYPNFVGR